MQREAPSCDRIAGHGISRAVEVRLLDQEPD